MNNWNDVTVYHYQQYVKLAQSIKDTNDAVEVWDFNISLVSLMFGLTIRETELLTNQDFLAKLKQLDFLTTEIPDQPTKRIKANANYYRMVYDARKVRNIPDLARFSKSGDVIAVKQFSADFIGNLHKVAASLVVPQKKVFGIYVDKKYDYRQHEQYANDLLDAPITAIYGYCLFFCKVFEKQISFLVDYLGENSAAMTIEERNQVAVLKKAMVGFSMLPKSQPISE